MVACPYCGSNISETAKFCGKCGSQIVKQNNLDATQIMNSISNGAPVAPPVQQNKTTQTILIVAAVAVAAAVGYGFWVNREADNKANMLTPSPTAKQQNITPTTDEHQKPVTQPTQVAVPNRMGDVSFDDFFLAGIQPGVSIDHAKKVLGKPIKIENGTYGVLYKFDAAEITVVGTDIVGNITVDRSSTASKRGVRVGDPVSSVLTKYGKAQVSTYGNQDMYEYTLEGNPPRILRFAVNKNTNKVEYIGSRLRL